MIYLKWDNLIAFLPQYIIGIIVAYYVFKKFSSKAPVNNLDFIALHKFNQYIKDQTALYSDLYSLSEKLEPLPDLAFSKFANSVKKTAAEDLDKKLLAENIDKALTEISDPVSADALKRYNAASNKDLELNEDLATLSNKLLNISYIGAPLNKFIAHTKYQKSEFSFFESLTNTLTTHLEELDLSMSVFLGLVTLLAVLLWASIVLLLTPYPQVSIFTPHFSVQLNLILNLVLGVSIFISLISIISFFIISTKTQVLVAEALVLSGTVISFFLPAMSWIRNSTFAYQLIVFLVAVSLALLITYFIMKIKDKNHNFMISLYFSYAAFLIFNLILTDNLVTFIMLHR
ncbi:MAG: hypothetical protein ACP5T1_03320 [Thermoplasmata archaeon]